MWAEASAALLHDWTEAGLIPAERWQLDTREAPGRQRKRLRLHSDFYDEYRLHLLPLSVAMLRLRWDRDAMLSLPLLDMKAGEAPVRTVNRLIPQLMREAAEAQQAHEQQQQQQQEEEQREETDGSEVRRHKEPSATPTVVLGEPSSPTPTAVVDGDGRPSPLSSDGAVRREASSANRSTIDEHDTQKEQDEDEDDGEEEEADGEKENDAFNLTNLALPRISIHAINQAKLTKPKTVQQQPQQDEEGGEEDKSVDEEDEDEDDEADADADADGDDDTEGVMSADNSIDEVASESGSEEEEDDRLPATAAVPPLAVTPASPTSPTSPTADLVSPSASQALSILSRLLQPHDSIPTKHGLFGCQRIQYLQHQSAVLLLTAHRLYIVHYFTVQDNKLRLTTDPPVSGLTAQSYHIKAKLRPVPSEQQSSKAETAGGGGDEEATSEGSGSGSDVPLLPSGEVDTSQLDVVLQADKIKKNSDELAALVALQQHEAQRKRQELLDGQFAPADHFCYDYSQIASIHRRRCQLRPTGIELLCRDGSSHLLSFGSKKERETVFVLIAKRAEARNRARSGQKGQADNSNGAGSPSTANVINTLTPALNRSTSLSSSSSSPSAFSPFLPAELDGGIVIKQKHIAAITEAMGARSAVQLRLFDVYQHGSRPLVQRPHTVSRVPLGAGRLQQ